MRLVILGGSASSTPELLDALAAWPGGPERRPDLTVVLVGRDETKLELVARGCRARPIGPGAPVAVEMETNRRRALDGADVVLNQVRVGGLDARAFDESFPRDFGLPGEETMGPGGFANALRTVPALRAIWADVAETAPAALVVNLTNPAGIVQQAAAEWPLRIYSVCDSPVAFLAAIAVRLGKPVAEVQQRYIGMNHLGWYVPESPDQLEELADLATGLGAEEVRLHQALPAPYVRYYVHPDRILESQRDKETRAQASNGSRPSFSPDTGIGPRPISHGEARSGIAWPSCPWSTPGCAAPTTPSSPGRRTTADCPASRTPSCSSCRTGRRGRGSSFPSTRS